MYYTLTLKSRNAKTGPIPVSTTSAETCPEACPFNNGNGCYAASGPLALFWRKVTEGNIGGNFSAFLASVSALPAGTLWRHNQAGDLPGSGDTIDTDALKMLVAANAGKRGFTYTHKPINTEANRSAVAAANANGFTINLSGNNLAHADELAELDAGPVVAVLRSDIEGNTKLQTPAGRRVVVCPATYRENVSCATCGLCAVRDRNVIVGFPAHGAGKKHADKVARI